VSFRRNTASGSAVPAAADAGTVATSSSGRMPSLGARLQRRLQRGTLLQAGFEGGKLPRAALQPLKVIAVPHQLVGVVRGTRHFPAKSALAAAASSSGGGAQAPAAAGECFTLLVQEEGAAQLLGVNMQLPPPGNGRSLDEWLLALRDLESAAGAPEAAVATTGAAAVTTMAAAEAEARGPSPQQPQQPQQPAGEPQPVQGPATPAGGYFSSEAGGAAAAAAAAATEVVHVVVNSIAVDGGSSTPPGSLASSSPRKVPRVRSRGWLLAAALPKPWPGPSSAGAGGGGGAGGRGGDDGSSGSDSESSSESSGD
jgi:hypothetical protein